ncbi:MAG: GlxA family transcriptional regulator [Chromatiales bacterium]
MSHETLSDNQDHQVGTTRNIVFVAFPDVQMLNVCGPFDAFSFANRMTAMSGVVAPPTYQLEVVAAQAGPLMTCSGLEIVAHHTYAEIDCPIDTLIVTGGVAALERAASDAALVGWIKETAPRVRRVASVCTGAFLLAAGGLLDGRRATTHWGFTKQLAEAYPSISIEADRIFVRDGNVYTSGGVTAGIDLALALVEEDLGRDIARLTAQIMVMFLRRPGDQSQFSTYLGSKADALRDRRWFRTWVRGQPDSDQSHEALPSLSVATHSRPDLRGLQTWILAHPHADLSIEALAERVAMSPRNFARLFVTETGMTPAKFVEGARLKAARCTLEQTALPIEAIAERCGFGDPERMRRSFRRMLRVSPQDYRARFKSTELH